jgi:voltage-gated potassium channel
MKYRSRIKSLILKELLVPLVLIIIIILIGFFGFIFIEGFSPLQSIYMLVSTYSMVGYGDVVPITDTGKVFTIIMILSGFAIGIISIGKISAFVVAGELSTLLKLRKMNKTLDAMKNHYIICGYGKTGKRVLDDLLAKSWKLL